MGADERGKQWVSLTSQEVQIVRHGRPMFSLLLHAFTFRFLLVGWWYFARHRAGAEGRFVYVSLTILRRRSSRAVVSCLSQSCVVCGVENDQIDWWSVNRQLVICLL
ncbi:unnamed protein product [Ectocarpus sp. 12 AP-2014]